VVVVIVADPAGAVVVPALVLVEVGGEVQRLVVVWFVMDH